MELKLYKSASGELAVALLNAGSQTAFGAEPMTEVIPGTTDAAVEKHVPVAAVDGNKVAVTVGSVEHPMTPAHYIEWIAIKRRRDSHAGAGNAPQGGVYSRRGRRARRRLRLLQSAFALEGVTRDRAAF